MHAFLNWNKLSVAGIEEAANWNSLRKFQWNWKVAKRGLTRLYVRLRVWIFRKDFYLKFVIIHFYWFQKLCNIKFLVRKKTFKRKCATDIRVTPQQKTTKHRKDVRIRCSLGRCSDEQSIHLAALQSVSFLLSTSVVPFDYID